MHPRVFAAAIVALAVLCGQGRAATILPPGEQCFSALAPTSGGPSNTGTGMVAVLGTITGGSGYTSGTYGGVSLTGGSGSGATANITVSGGAVSAVVILNPGSQYVVGDVLSATAASIGGTGAGFSVPVTVLAINSALAGGSVGFYQPNTLNFKQTWNNADQAAAHLNANPVILDQNGCAIIYGSGIYRQILKDSLGNTVWDQVTSDTSASNSVFWAGVAGGTPNVITLVDPGFNGTDGTVVNFTALSTNTGASTINPSSFGAIVVLKDTTGGPVGLIGGEIVASNPVSVVYRSSDNAFHLLNTVIASASGAAAPLCGATGLKVTNSVGTPNTIIALSADQVVMQTPAGITVNRSNVSLTINTTLGNVTSAAGGMDGEAPGTSQWLNVWVIDNGAAAAGLASVTATAPTMPSGYTYKCRLASMRVDGSGNLLRTLQLGRRAQYVIVAGSNTPNFAIIVSGTNTASAVTPFSISALVPPTATNLRAMLAVAASTSAMLGANSAYTFGVIGTGSQPLYLSAVASNPTAIYGEMLLESTNVFFASNSASTAAYVAGWDDKVNAN